MKIVELGYSGVGKTTYMASMYSALQQKIQGFSLRADQDDHQQLMYLAQKIKNGNYPLGTERREEYNFKLQHNNKNVLSFDYIDYRGGDTTKSTQESQDAGILQNDLREADGIIIFFDYSALANNSQSQKVKSEIRRITALVTNALSDVKTPMSLAVVLTKTDLVSEFQEHHLEPIRSLIGAVEVSSMIRGAIIPIACGSEAINVEIPLLFAVHVGVANLVNSLNSEIQECQDDAKYYEKRRKRFIIGGLEGIVNTISGNPTNKDRARWALEEAKKKRQELQPIILPANSLNQYIRQLPLIKSNTTMTKYVKKLNQIKTGIPLFSRILNFLGF